MTKPKPPKRKGKSRGDSGGNIVRTEPPSLIGSGSGHKSSPFERVIQRVKRWFGPLPDDADDEPINAKHDLASQRLSERELLQEPEWSHTDQRQGPEPASRSPLNTLPDNTPPDMRVTMALFRTAIKALNTKIEGLDRRLALLEDPVSDSTVSNDWRDVSNSTNETRGKYNPSSPERKGGTAYASRERQVAAVRAENIDAVEQAVCRALDEVHQGAFDLESLVQRIQSASSCKLDLEFLGPHSQNEWRMVILWSGGESEGLVLVSRGELVDSEITQYFEGEFGRRIISCRRPARVVRRGGQVGVSRKGLVENS